MTVSMKSIFCKSKFEWKKQGHEGPPGIGRNHEHKVGFRRNRGFLLRNDSDLRGVVLPSDFMILAVLLQRGS
ncbi:hypothetical protein ACFVYC_04695 [Pseudarthrobacter sp. NPDC058329]|uniref:hypothetical protein n=1 Tax=Pseudarthrobacter sp. NPDC058329 TaxID=3346448 RepID=UPI0036DF1220